MPYNFEDNSELAITLKHSPELKKHLLYLIEKQQAAMSQKIMQQTQKQQRIRKIEDQFIKWADEKNRRFHTQIERAGKNKEDHISKIVKRCKDRTKFVLKKHQDQKQHYKKSMKQAWKKAQKFNQDLITYHKSKQINNNKSHQYSTPQAYSVHFQMNNNTQSNFNRNKLNSINQIKNISSYMNLNNNSNIFGITQFEEMPETKEQNYNETDMKINQTIQRLRQKDQSCEKLKIQKLGEKLQKISKSRARRQQNFKKNNKTTIEKDQYQTNKIKTKLQNKTKRVHSETFYKSNSRVADHSADVKNNREQMFQKQLSKGNNYLQNLKIRHLKTVLAKNIAYNAIEKKLFIQRFNS